MPQTSEMFGVDENNDMAIAAVRSFIAGMDEGHRAWRFGWGHRPEDFDATTVNSYIATSDNKPIGGQNKVVGLVDFHESDEYRSNTATVNIIVAESHCGKGNNTSKFLLANMDEKLRADGFKYKAGNVYSNHEDHIERLKKNEWKKSTKLPSHAHFDAYWKSLGDDDAPEPDPG